MIFGWTLLQTSEETVGYIEDSALSLVSMDESQKEQIQAIIYTVYEVL